MISGPCQGKWQIDFNYPLAARGINKHNRKIVLALAGGVVLLGGWCFSVVLGGFRWLGWVVALRLALWQRLEMHDS